MMTSTLTGLEGRIAIVTGAGRMRSIGRAIAHKLGAAGCDVVLIGTGRDPSRFPAEEQNAGWQDIHSVAEEVQAYGVQAFPLVADISQEAEVDRIFDEVSANVGIPSILVNNAAASRGDDRKPVIELDVTEWDTVQRVNVRGTFLMSRAFAKRAVSANMAAGIVNISSIGGKLSGPNTAAYSASKAAVQSLTSSMAKELGSVGIRVNALCPGVIDTSRLADRTAEEWDTYVRASIPLQRLGTGEDVAHAALFLLSDEASWITGQSWNIDGGQLTIR